MMRQAMIDPKSPVIPECPHPLMAKGIISGYLVKENQRLLSNMPIMKGVNTA